MRQEEEGDRLGRLRICRGCDWPVGVATQSDETTIETVPGTCERQRMKTGGAWACVAVGAAGICCFLDRVGETLRVEEEVHPGGLFVILEDENRGGPNSVPSISSAIRWILGAQQQQTHGDGECSVRVSEGGGRDKALKRRVVPSLV